MKSSPLLIVFITVFIDLLGFGILIPLAPFFAVEFGADGITFSWLMAVYSIMQFIFSPMWGRLSDRVGRRPIMLLSLAASTTGYIIFALADSLFWLFISRIIAGFGAANISTAQAIIADTMPPEKRTKGMGIVGMAIGFGFTFGPALAFGFLFFYPESYAPIFWAAAALSGFDLLLAYFILPETRSSSGSKAVQEKRFSLSRLKLALSVPVVSTLLISSLTFYIAFSMMEVMLGLFGEKAFGLSAFGYSGIMFGVGLILAFVQGGLVHHVAKRIGDLNTLCLGLFGIAVGLLTLGYSGSITTMVVSTSILAAFVGLSNPALTSLISQYSAADIQGGMLGLNQSMASLGRILGPIIGGLCFDYIHIRSPFAVGAFMIFVVFVILVKLNPPPPQTEQQSSKT